jgi:thiol-disulfide isomerase/thioredoxin
MKHPAFSGLALIGLLWCACAAAAPPDTLALTDLVNRPDRWPTTVSLVGDFTFGNGMVVHQTDKLPIVGFDGTRVKLIGPRNALIGVKAQDCNLLDAANQAWTALTPAQRAVDMDSLVADMSLWPIQVTMPTGINCSLGRLAPGTNTTLVSISNKGAALNWPNSTNWLTVDFATTDVFARARQLVLLDPDKRPSRMAAALKGILVDANGKPVQDDLENKKIFAIYYGAGWCPPCRDFSPNLVKFLNDALPSHPELAAVFLSDDKQPADMLAYMQDEKMPCPAVSLKDVEASHILSSYLVDVIPHMVIVDRYGKILATNDDNKGNRGDPSDTLAALGKLLAAPAK